MKIKTSVTTTTEVEKEIELPYYSKHGNTYFKIIGEDKVIVVTDYIFSQAIEISSSHLQNALAPDRLLSNEHEFNRSFNRVMEYLINFPK